MPANARSIANAQCEQTLTTASWFSSRTRLSICIGESTESINASVANLPYCLGSQTVMPFCLPWQMRICTLKRSQHVCRAMLQIFTSWTFLWPTILLKGEGGFGQHEDILIAIRNYIHIIKFKYIGKNEWVPSFFVFQLSAFHIL